MHAAASRRIWLVGAAIVTAVALPLCAHALATRYHDDSLWANAVASLGGSAKPGDFGYVFLTAGDNVLAGRDPYMDPDEFHGPPQAPYAYPPVLAIVVTPLSALPERVDNFYVPGMLFTLLLIAAIIAGLRLLDVRDLRCYAVALLYPVTLESFEYGAVGPILFLLIAIAWRWRDGVAAVAGSAGGLIVLKLFLWPLLVWLAVTRRIRAAVLATATAFLLAALSWVVIRFQGLGDYPRLLRRLVDVEADNSYSAYAILKTLGLSGAATQALLLVGAAVLFVAMWRTARAPELSRLEQDRRSLTLAIAAALLLTPILWLHYLVLLLVPIALARPRLSLLWFAPLTLTVFELLDWYRGWPQGDGKALASVAAVVAIVFVGSLRQPGARTRSRQTAPAGAV